MTTWRRRRRFQMTTTTMTTTTGPAAGRGAAVAARRARRARGRRGLRPRLLQRRQPRRRHLGPPHHRARPDAGQVGGGAEVVRDGDGRLQIQHPVPPLPRHVHGFTRTLQCGQGAWARPGGVGQGVRECVAKPGDRFPRSAAPRCHARFGRAGREQGPQLGAGQERVPGRGGEGVEVRRRAGPRGAGDEPAKGGAAGPGGVGEQVIGERCRRLIVAAQAGGAAAGGKRGVKNVQRRVVDAPVGRICCIPPKVLHAHAHRAAVVVGAHLEAAAADARGQARGGPLGRRGPRVGRVREDAGQAGSFKAGGKLAGRERLKEGEGSASAARLCPLLSIPPLPSSHPDVHAGQIISQTLGPGHQIACRHRAPSRPLAARDRQLRPRAPLGAAHRPLVARVLVDGWWDGRGGGRRRWRRHRAGAARRRAAGGESEDESKSPTAPPSPPHSTAASPPQSACRRARQKNGEPPPPPPLTRPARPAPV